MVKNNIITEVMDLMMHMRQVIYGNDNIISDKEYYDYLNKYIQKMDIDELIRLLPINRVDYYNVLIREDKINGIIND